VAPDVCWASTIEGQPPPSQQLSIFCRQSAHHHADRIQKRRWGLPVSWQSIHAIVDTLPDGFKGVRFGRVVAITFFGLPAKRTASVLIALACLPVALNACGDSGSDDKTAVVDHFEANRAWKTIEQQVKVGQRPAGSPQLRQLATRIRTQLPAGKFESIPGQPGLRNVVGTLPGIKPAIVLGAHYDTLTKPRGFVGANNGAAGSAIAIEAASALERLPTKPGDREVRFVLFDGEEPAAGLPENGTDFYHEGLRGSRAYVAAHGSETGDMILLDYVGNAGLQLPREGSSDPVLWAHLRRAAAAVGAEHFFPPGTGPSILDDHTPFLRAQIPAIDLIDWKYPGHSLADGLDKLSRTSIDGVGEAVVRLVEEMRR
jgi:glutaminyl-peptide cyclotransferase